MTAAFFLMLREGLEAALIVGIIAAYLVKSGRRDALGSIALGVGAAVALAVGAGIVVASTVGNLPLVLRATIEGVAAVAAVVVLTWMLFWMRRQGRAIKGDLERGVDAALAVGSTRALAGLAFIAVVREGLETVLFLFAIGSSSGDVVPLFVASVAGLAVAVAIGWAIFALGIRIDLRRFFTVTGIVLIFVSAGLVSYGIAEFTETGLLPVTPVAFDLSGTLPESGLLGSLLAGLFGYTSAPTVLQVIGYLAYLIPVLFLFVSGPRRPRIAPAAVATMAVVLMTALAACSSGSGGDVTSTPAEPADTTIDVVATEYEFDPSALSAPAGSVAFKVTNKGSEEHEFEIFKGDQVVDEIEGLVPGLDRTLTVTLDPGEYTFACMLSGHDLAGMTGTLTVTPS
jgi:high-affinity iron transporter